MTTTGPPLTRGHEHPPAAGCGLSSAEFVADLYRAHAVTLIRIALLLLGDQPTAEDVV